MALDDPPTSAPAGLRWRASTPFILATIGIGMFTDLFLYGLVVPVLPFVLRDRLHVPPELIQSHVSGLLAAYSGAQVIFSVPTGWVADRWGSRRGPFLAGLAALFAATAMLAFGESVAVVVVARLLQGVSAAAVWTVGLAMIIDTVGPGRLGEIIGSIFSFITVGELIAPVSGGVLYDQAGYLGVFGLATGLLVVDFVLRLLVLEKKTAKEYDENRLGNGDAENGQDSHVSRHSNGDAQAHTDEAQPLLATQDHPSDSETFKITDSPTGILAIFPLLYCFRSPRLLTGFFLAFVQAAIYGMFDATLPTEAQDLYGFNSLQAGLLFVPLALTNLVLGPIAGRAVDRYGTKPMSVAGFALFVPALALLRLPEMRIFQEQGHNIALNCVLLALNGVGLAMISSPSIVETSYVVQRYDEANPGFFGDNGPYAQLYGFNGVFFCAGLTVGPLLGGGLRDAMGYGNMNAVFASLSGITAILSWLYIGGPPRILGTRPTRAEAE